MPSCMNRDLYLYVCATVCISYSQMVHAEKRWLFCGLYRSWYTEYSNSVMTKN